MRLIIIFISFFYLITAKAAHSYIDLTHEFSKDTLSWPESKPFSILHTFAETMPTGFYVSARDYESNEHLGTHIDAPNHFVKNHGGVDQISLSSVIGPAIKIDVTNKAKINPDYQVNIDDFHQWEIMHGTIPEGSIILLSTGWGKYWPQWEKYAGTHKTGENSLKDLHFPGLDPKAAKWLVNIRKIKAIGIDTFSIDYGQTTHFHSHQLLTKSNIPIFENVADMQKIPDNNFYVYALPMKIKNGTGAPLRIIADISAPINIHLTDVQNKIKKLCENRYRSPDDFIEFADKLMSLGVVRQTYDVLEDDLIFYSKNAMIYHLKSSEIDKSIPKNPSAIGESLDLNRLKKSIDNIDTKQTSAVQFHQELARSGVVYVNVYLKQRKIYYLSQDGQYFLETY